MSQPSHSESSPGYTHTAPFDSGFLPVGTIHKLHYEQYGKKDGKPGKLVSFLQYGANSASQLSARLSKALHKMLHKKDLAYLPYNILYEGKWPQNSIHIFCHRITILIFYVTFPPTHTFPSQTL
jgi:hypothetical protein